MTWLNITEEQQLYDSLDIDIVRTYNESPNGYTRTHLNWTFLSASVAANQRLLNTANPEINTGSVNTFALIKFTSPIARSIGKSEVKTICGAGDWFIINETAGSDVPLIDLNSFDFAQFFYYVTLSFSIVADVAFTNGATLSGSPLSLTYLDSSRKVLWSANGIEDFGLGYNISPGSTFGVSNYIIPTSNITTTNTASFDSELTYSFNLEYVLNQNSSSPGSRYLGFLFDVSRIFFSGSSYRWVIDKVQFEIKRIKK